MKAKIILGRKWWPVVAGFSDGSWLLLCGLLVVLAVLLVAPPPLLFFPAFLGSCLGLLLAGTLSADGPTIRVEVELDSAGVPKNYRLVLGYEYVALSPGKTWSQLDHYKWVTRGLLEEPQSFHVAPDGAVEINGERIHLDEPEGAARLEVEFNKRHPLSGASAVRAAGTKHQAVPGKPLDPGRVHFRVKLDHFGHLAIECFAGTEQTETGLRGLASLVEHGLMSPPKDLHVDPLQESVEIDGVRYGCTQEGARRLEEALNTRYAPELHIEDGAIEIKESPASSTGFDIHFFTFRAGTRFEIKGHLSQENLDILQDSNRCDLLRPGIILRLSPPYLLVRRRHPDGGEEKLPQFPDLQYRRATALQLQRMLNHPTLRRVGGATETAARADGERLPPLTSVRVVRHPQDKMHLWLECGAAGGKEPVSRALTHHNVAELQQNGVFQPHLDVTASLDHRTLSLLDKSTGHEQHIRADIDSSDEELAGASALLTGALRTPPLGVVVAEQPPAAPPPPKAQVLPTTMPAPAKVAIPQQNPARPAAKPSTPPPQVSAAKDKPPSALGLRKTESPLEHHLRQSVAGVDAGTVILHVFASLSPRFSVPVQQVRLSLPGVFEDRLFEVVSFSHPEVTDLQELRGESFYGFYLSHINDHRFVLVYACLGQHIEWGAERCLVQDSLSAEAREFKGGGLLGLAQNQDNHFIFLVAPKYKEWIKGHEKHPAEAFAHFLTLDELAPQVSDYRLIWPAAPDKS